MKKVLSIKNLKPLPAVPVAFQETQWNKLEKAIVSILNSENPNESYEELYRTVENLQGCNCRDFIYESFYCLLENYLVRKIESLLANGVTLEVIDTTWDKFCAQIVTIKNIFLCFDRSPKKGKYNTVQFVSYNLFKSYVVYNPQLKKYLTDGIFSAIEEERNGKTLDVKMLKSLVNMLTELQIYNELFQYDFIKLSEVYYSDEANRLIQNLDVDSYLQHASKRIEQENQRIATYLNKNTGTPLLETLHKFLIKDHTLKLLQNGFHNLVEENNNKALSLMYELFKKVALGIKMLTEYFTNYITLKGLEIVSDPENEKNMIQDVLDFKDKLHNIIKKSFNNDAIFHHALKNSFSKFINSRQSKPAQLLSKYIDNKLRCKETAEADLETTLDKIMVIFRFIQGKDIFEAFYKRDLAKRLLLGKSTSKDVEYSMIVRLKLECGCAFTSKIEGMFNDINVSQSINNTFKQYLFNTKNEEEINRSPSDVCINVLTSSYWPNYPNFEINFPAELANYQTTFQKFYSTNHNGRKLFWQPSLCHCVVKADFEGGKKELQVSLFQTIVLLLFNNSNTLTYKDIQEATNLESDELKKTLISLACGKTRVLIKKSKEKAMEDEDVFLFNSKFTDKLFRVRVNQIQLKESPEEERATEKSVLTDRQFQIDAAIVRIMKNKKMISHNALISELFNVLDIPVKPSDLKKRIELLIERDYMERDKNNSSTYIYLA